MPIDDYLAAWGFNEGTGTAVAEESGAHPNGALQAGAGWDTTTPKYGAAAVTFTTVAADFVTCGLTGGPFGFTNGYTLMCWARTSSTANSAEAAKCTNTEGPWIYLWDDGNVYAGHDNTSFFEATFAGYGTGAWHHWAVTWDPADDTVRLYRDGVEVDTTTGVTTPPSVGVSGINFGWNMTGAVDDVRYYQRALTPAEIVEARDTAVGDETSGDPPQFARPTGTAVTAGWTAVSAADIPTALGGTTPNDATAARSENSPATSRCAVPLSGVTDPGVDSGFTLRYRYDREDVSGTPTENLIVYLRQGYTNDASRGTEIQSWTHNGVADTLVTGEQLVTNAAAITDFSTGTPGAGLWVELEATQA